MSGYLAYGSKQQIVWSFWGKLTNVGGKQWPQISLYKTNEMTPKPIKRNLKHTFWNPGVKKTMTPPFGRLCNKMFLRPKTCLVGCTWLTLATSLRLPKKFHWRCWRSWRTSPWTRARSLPRTRWPLRIQPLFGSPSQTCSRPAQSQCPVWKRKKVALNQGWAELTIC